MWSRELASPGCKWSFLPAFAVLFGVRAASAVTSREETRESGEDCTAARFPLFLFSAPGVKAQRNLQRPPGPAQTGLQLSARLSPFSPGVPRTLGAGGGLAAAAWRGSRGPTSPLQELCYFATFYWTGFSSLKGSLEIKSMIGNIKLLRPSRKQKRRWKWTHMHSATGGKGAQMLSGP